MRKLWTIRWFRVLLGVVLTAALLAPVVLPALQMQRQEPGKPDPKGEYPAGAPTELWRRETAARLPPRRLRRKPEQAAASPGRSRILNSRRRSRPARTCPSSCLSSPDPTRSRSPARNPASSPVRGPTASRTTPETRRSPTHSTLASYSPGTATAGSAIAHSARRIRPCGRTCARAAADGKLRYELELRGLDAGRFPNHQRRDFGKQRRIYTGGRTRQHCHAGRPAGRGQLLYAPRAGSLHARAGGRSTAGAGDGILLRAALFRRA